MGRLMDERRNELLKHPSKVKINGVLAKGLKDYLKEVKEVTGRSRTLTDLVNDLLYEAFMEHEKSWRHSLDLHQGEVT